MRRSRGDPDCPGNARLVGVAREQPEPHVRRGNGQRCYVQSSPRRVRFHRRHIVRALARYCATARERPTILDRHRDPRARSTPITVVVSGRQPWSERIRSFDRLRDQVFLPAAFRRTLRLAVVRGRQFRAAWTTRVERVPPSQLPDIRHPPGAVVNRERARRARKVARFAVRATTTLTSTFRAAAPVSGETGF